MKTSQHSFPESTQKTTDLSFKLKTTVTHNRNVSFTHETSKKYIRRMAEHRFHSATKNSRCEAKIYLNLPSFKNEQNFYYNDFNLKTVVKDPFWINLKTNNKIEQWRKSFLNTMPKYSLLICPTRKSSNCNEHNKNYWISSVSYERDRIILRKTIMILELQTLKKYLYVLCPYCDPFDPFKLILADTMHHQNTKDLWDNYLNTIKRPSHSPYSIAVNLMWYLDDYLDLVRKTRRHKRAVLEHLSHINLTRVSQIPFLADTHIMFHLLSENSTIKFQYTDDGYVYRWKNIPIRYNAQFKSIKYHPNFRPSILRQTDANLGFFQDLGLLFRRQKLQFVSCHSEQASWMNALKELVHVFDIYTWLMLIGLFILASKIMKYISHDLHGVSLGETVFQLYASFLDQSSSVFGNKKMRINPIFYLSFACIPMVFFYVNNLYKGDNITRFTLDPPLTPFDTFRSLVENHFEILVRRYSLANPVTAYGMKVLNVKKAFVQENGHEAFPIVSELWYMLMMRWTVNRWKRLNALKDQFSETTWYYLNNSKLFPPWFNSYGQPGQKETVSQILEMQMNACNKSAVILNGEDRNVLYNIMKAKGKPVWNGKDLIHEQFVGYKYFGHFPTHMLLRSKYYLETGITEWWAKFFEWSIMVKVRVNETNENAVNGNNDNRSNASKSAVYTLSCIPTVGLALSMIVFVLFDSNVVNMSYHWIRMRILRISDKVLKIKQKLWINV